MSEDNRRLLHTNEPVKDSAHTEINPDTGMQKDYVILSAEERAKGFVKPVRSIYVHRTCGAATTMGRELSETYARDPYFYSGTFCCTCSRHCPLEQFDWDDGEPMEPSLQPAWAERQAKTKADRNQLEVEKLERFERAELARLKAKYER
jgi:hypothetical protein